MAQRFFLGVFEAGVSPAFLSLLGMFYTKREQALRTPILYASNGITIIPLLAISYGLVTIDSIPPWKTIYYFLGALTIVWAVVFGLFVPDSPVAARFLTPRQKFVAVERLPDRFGLALGQVAGDSEGHVQFVEDDRFRHRDSSDVCR